MSLMQSLAEFKQSLHGQAHSPAGMAGRSGAVSTTGRSLAAEAGGQTASARPATAAAASGSGASSGTDSTTITANDFLQLLVAEMKNQDPTADQDPNAYIDQLVQVNSLQQLIAINHDLNPTGSGQWSGRTSTARADGRAGQGSVNEPGSEWGSEAGIKPANGPASGPQLGSAEGTPAASVATALAPHPGQALRSGEGSSTAPASLLGLGAGSTGRPLGESRRSAPR